GPVPRVGGTLPRRSDRHGCGWADPNLDGLLDLVCAKGAQQGTAKKWNELWIQGPPGVWHDEAHTRGIEDVWGRGRHPEWIDLNHDTYPDLFMGNDEPRADNHISPNRTYENVGGTHFKQVNLGITKQDGSSCVQTVDVNHDGKDDLLLCGDKRTILYVRQGDRFVGGDARYGGPPEPIVNGAQITDVSGDGIPDLVLVALHGLTVRLGTADGS